MAVTCGAEEAWELTPASSRSFCGSQASYFEALLFLQLHNSIFVCYTGIEDPCIGPSNNLQGLAEAKPAAAGLCCVEVSPADRGKLSHSCRKSKVLIPSIHVFKGKPQKYLSLVSMCSKANRKSTDPRSPCVQRQTSKVLILGLHVSKGKPHHADPQSATASAHRTEGCRGMYESQMRAVALTYLTSLPFNAGGLLVLEPQPWRSYCQAITKKQTSAVPFRNLEALRLRPEAFIDTLTNVSVKLWAVWWVSNLHRVDFTTLHCTRTISCGRFLCKFCTCSLPALAVLRSFYQVILAVVGG
eukprot:898504-Pelagomonas_calceolata.AAC.1